MGVRNAGLDLVRVVGILAVVAGHVWDGGVSRTLLYTWHVPLFFFLSGYLWTARRPMRVELSKRWPTLALPYMVWLVLLGVPFVVWLAASTGSIKPSVLVRLLLGGSYVGRPLSAFWFVGALFAGAIAYRALQSLPRPAVWATAAAVLTMSYLAPELVRAVPLGAGVGVSALVFLMAGSMMREVRPPRPVAAGGLSLAAGAALVATGAAAPLDMKAADFGTPVVSVLAALLISAGLVLLGLAVGERMGARVSRLVTLFASCGLMVVLTHAAVLWVLDTPASGGVLYFAAATVVPWGLALLANRSRLSTPLTGAPQIGSRRVASRA